MPTDMLANTALNLSQAPPFLAEGYVNLIARTRSGTVRCRVSVKTLEQMSRSADDPLEAFERNRPKIEAMFRKLFELGFFDEEGAITFSTVVRRDD